MLFVVRHGQTAANAAGQLLGRADVPLTETGQRPKLEKYAAAPSDAGVLVFVQGGEVYSWNGVTNNLLSANASGAPAMANMEFVIPALSPDGRFAAFESAAETASAGTTPTRESPLVRR